MEISRTLDEARNTRISSPSWFGIDGYEISDGIFTARFRVVEDGAEILLEERIDFRAVPEYSEPESTLLRLLTLACSVSYYKASSACIIDVGFALSPSEKEFLATLVREGLTEYAYRNNRRDKLSPTILGEILADTLRDKITAETWQISRRPLVAVGGGKDSVVTIEALKQAGKNPVLFAVNIFEPIIRCVVASGCEFIQVLRTLDPKLKQLNANGSLNGHVPVTAINSLIGLVVADAGALGSLVMSNEASANSGNLNWDGIEVNHQWSKSIFFEDLLRNTLTADGLSPDRYFSLLRSLQEIEIAETFARYPAYFFSFTSCNRLFKLDPTARSLQWCCECAKCQFVFLILAPYIAKETLVEIFGTNLLDDATNLEAYKEIIGASGHKPFDCVGEYEEAVDALVTLSHRDDWASDAIVIALSDSPTATARPAGTALVPPISRDDRVPVEYLAARTIAGAN